MRSWLAKESSFSVDDEEAAETTFEATESILPG